MLAAGAYDEDKHLEVSFCIVQAKKENSSLTLISLRFAAAPVKGKASCVPPTICWGRATSYGDLEGVLLEILVKIRVQLLGKVGISPKL